MPDPTTLERLRGLVLSATEIKGMTGWPSAMVEDYLNILDNLITLATLLDVEIDQKLEEVPTDFTDGSIPFAEGGFLVEDNDAIFWDNVNKRLGININTPAEALDILGNALVTGNITLTGDLINTLGAFLIQNTVLDEDINFSTNDGGVQHTVLSIIGALNALQGYLCTASGEGSIALGNASIASALNAIAMGSLANAGAGNAISIGRNSNADGLNATALGTNSDAGGSASLALGGGDASGDSAVSLGGSEASGADSFAVIADAIASGIFAQALGFVTASGDGSVAQGGWNGKVIASAQMSMAYGDNFTNATANSLAIGFGAITQLITANYIENKKGLIQSAVATKTSDYTLTTSDLTILADGTSNTVDITLPAAPETGRVYEIKCINSTFKVTILRNSKTIDGDSVDFAIYEDESVTLKYDGTGWQII